MTQKALSDVEFTFHLQEKRIETIHQAFANKSLFVYDSLRSAQNPYGIQKDTKFFDQQLPLLNTNPYALLKEICQTEQPEALQGLLNYLYLQSEFYTLILALYHRNPFVKKTALTLLLNGFELEPILVSFFQSFFEHQNSFKILIIPTDLKDFFVDYLSRDCVRWLTALYQQTHQKELWNFYTPQEVKASLKTQQQELKFFTKAAVPNQTNTSNEGIITEITEWLKKISSSAEELQKLTFLADQNKVRDLSSKWGQADLKIGIAHKLISYLLERWSNQKESSDFAQTFILFLSELSLTERQLFFLYCTAIEDETIMRIALTDITEIAPITQEIIFANPQTSQAFVKAIVQAKIYGELYNPLDYFSIINQHLTDLLMQFQEVEDIFIPNLSSTSESFLDRLKDVSNEQGRNVTYPETKLQTEPHHFHVKTPRRKFISPLVSNSCSAAQTQALTGIAMTLNEIKVRSAALPTKLSEYEFKSRCAFKPSSKFQPRYTKRSQKVVKQMTLEDVFGSQTQPSQEQNNT